MRLTRGLRLNGSKTWQIHKAGGAMQGSTWVHKAGAFGQLTSKWTCSPSSWASLPSPATLIDNPPS